MKVKILKSTVADLHRVEAGEVYDLSVRDAEMLISSGKAEPYKATPKKKSVKKRLNNGF